MVWIRSLQMNQGHFNFVSVHKGQFVQESPSSHCHLVVGRPPMSTSAAIELDQCVDIYYRREKSQRTTPRTVLLLNLFFLQCGYLLHMIITDQTHIPGRLRNRLLTRKKKYSKH